MELVELAELVVLVVTGCIGSWYLLSVTMCLFKYSISTNFNIFITIKTDFSNSLDL